MYACVAVAVVPPTYLHDWDRFAIVSFPNRLNYLQKQSAIFFFFFFKKNAPHIARHFLIFVI
jgi:hypothetical protein